MLSHDLARELLSHRNNDVRVQVLVDDDPTAETYRTILVELRDTDLTLDPDLNKDQLVTYDADKDVIVLRAGLVPIGEPDEDDDAPPNAGSAE